MGDIILQYFQPKDHDFSRYSKFPVIVKIEQIYKTPHQFKKAIEIDICLETLTQNNTLNFKKYYYIWTLK